MAGPLLSLNLQVPVMLISNSTLCVLPGLERHCNMDSSIRIAMTRVIEVVTVRQRLIDFVPVYQEMFVSQERSK